MFLAREEIKKDIKIALLFACNFAVAFLNELKPLKIIIDFDFIYFCVLILSL